MRLIKFIWSIPAILTTVWMLPFLSAAGEITLSQQNFYAGEKCRLKIAFPSNFTRQSAIAWTINSMGAQLCAGNALVNPDGTFEIEFNAPRLNPDVSVKAEFICRNVSGTPAVPLFFRSAEIFTPSAAIDALKLNVLKTGEAEEPLTAAFKTRQIPYKQISSIEEFDGQALIICGMDFDENQEVAKALTVLAGQGKKIILLPPLKGHFPAGSRQFDQILLDKSGCIKRFNKDFDLPLTAGSFTASARDEAFVLNCSNQADGFSCGIFKTGSGAVIISTWDLAKMQETDPSAWYLLKIWLLNTENVKISKEML